MILFVIEIATLISGITFLWVTSIAGLKFYRSDFQKSDVGQIKWAIHSTFVIILLILSMLHIQGFLSGNTQKDDNKVETEKVETK